MTLRDDASIERLALGVIDRSLPKKEWTHAGHFAAALWMLRFRPDLTAPQALRKLIMGYNDATGTANSATGGYHHTISIASLRAAAHHLTCHRLDAPLYEVLRSLLLSPTGRSDWPLAFWHRTTLFSVTARKSWVEPDLAPLPF